MNYLGWIVIAATLAATTLAHPKDNGPQIFEQKSARPPLQESPRQPRHQKYQEVIMYLTPSQIRHLEETQSEHGMILPTAQPHTKSQNEELQQQLLKQESRSSLEQELSKQSAIDAAEKELQQELSKQEDRKNLEQQLLKEESAQNHQKQVEHHLQQQFLNQEANRHLEQQLLNQAASQSKEQQLLKQEYERQQSQNHTELNSEEITQNLEKYSAQQLEQTQHLKQPQYVYLNLPKENTQEIPSSESKQLFYPEPEFIKLIQQQHQQQQLNNFLQTQPQQKFQHDLHSQPQLQLQLHSQPQFELRPEPQIELRPQPQIELRPKPQFELRPEPQIKLRPQPQIELRRQPQIELHPQPQIQLKPQQQLEIKQQQNLEAEFLDEMSKQNFRLIPYEYIPEQQDAHQQLGQQIFQHQLQSIQESQNNLESERLKLKQQEDVELGKEIIKEHLQYLHEESNRQAEALLQEQNKLSQLNQKVALLDKPRKDQSEVKPVYESQNALPKDTPKIQDLPRLDLLQILQNNEQRNSPKSQLSHLDILKPYRQLSHLQYAPFYNDQKFSLADIEKVIKNIQEEKVKAQATIDAINKSPAVVVKEENVIKRRPIELIKTVKVPVLAPYLVPQPYEVKVPQPYAVPLEIIKPYAVPIVKTEKVEVEKPVPVEVEKRVPYEVEKKVYVPVDKPYTVDRIVPVEINKEVPVEIPIYKPKKLTILRHIWEH